jgi:hypothetical protein
MSNGGEGMSALSVMIFLRRHTRFNPSRLCVIVATVVGLANATPSMADLIGTNVSGVMTIEGFPNNNFFDPVEGFVPAGFGNRGCPGRC